MSATVPNVLLILGCVLEVVAIPGMLKPIESESRDLRLLDGIWQFRVDRSSSRHQSFDQKWWEKPLSQSGPVIDMPVPASYNDVTEDKTLRDFSGWAFYEKTFFVSADWSKNKRIIVRLDSAHYNAIVWVNGKEVVRHEGGHLPFEAQVNDAVSFTGANRITVAVDNTLTHTTLPPGSINFHTDTSRYTPGYFTQGISFDFFNYAGIHRHVTLYTTPNTYVEDITILTDVKSGIGHVSYSVNVAGGTSNNVHVVILDHSNQVVAQSSKLSDDLTITAPNLWWPFGMNKNVGYVYILQVNASGDVYRQHFGIRTIRVTENQFLINEKPFYCLGVGKHEDSDFRGKGLDYTLITKDFNMLRWLGVNCFRTSHYPYAEEIMEFADRQGVAVIDESPGVGIGTSNFGNESLTHHLAVMSEMIRRDKNKPSVIMWSIANEPASDASQGVNYFKSILEYTKQHDPAHRPVTFVSDKGYENDKVVPYVDVICINRYAGWYGDTGHTEFIQRQIEKDFAGFRQKYNKPIILSEYGADTIPGIHMAPSFVFSEEYQVELLEQYHQVFDVARKTFLVGEMIWNFADFMTPDGLTRVLGNRKGILTRQRQPKQAAFLVRERYNSIASAGTSSLCGNTRTKFASTPHEYTLP